MELLRRGDTPGLRAILPSAPDGSGEGFRKIFANLGALKEVRPNNATYVDGQLNLAQKAEFERGVVDYVVGLRDGKVVGFKLTGEVFATALLNAAASELDAPTVMHSQCLLPSGEECGDTLRRNQPVKLVWLLGGLKASNGSFDLEVVADIHRADGTLLASHTIVDGTLELDHPSSRVVTAHITVTPTESLTLTLRVRDRNANLEVAQTQALEPATVSAASTSNAFMAPR